MTLFFGICFFLYFLKLPAGRGFWTQFYIGFETQSFHQNVQHSSNEVV